MKGHGGRGERAITMVRARTAMWELVGGSGADSLGGRADSDWVYGGASNDGVAGGAGSKLDNGILGNEVDNTKSGNSGDGRDIFNAGNDCHLYRADLVAIAVWVILVLMMAKKWVLQCSVGFIDHGQR